MLRTLNLMRSFYGFSMLLLWRWWNINMLSVGSSIDVIWAWEKSELDERGEAERRERGME
jgi:hypothetical protein